MSGTTLCPHCDTRFKIAEPQLEAHQGMVRCGSCLKAFDARPNFIPDEPDPQLVLPILEEPSSSEATGLKDEIQTVGEVITEKTVPLEAQQSDVQPTEAKPEDATHTITQPTEVQDDEAPCSGQTIAVSTEPGGEDTTVQPLSVAVSQPKTLAEQVVIVQDENVSELKPEYRRWPWVVASVLLVLLVFVQVAYFFRGDLAARLPGLKPTLVAYCRILGCSVPLQQKTDLMSIESSDLEAEPEHENQIILNALLRNRAPYPQAFPNLELTLNDTNDKPLARRTFKPKDYLPPQASEQVGLLPNHELIVKLYLGTADLRPTGYRLGLFYPRP